MNIVHLAAWQWKDYDRFHRDPFNLAIHFVAVPLFWLGVALIVLTPVVASWKFLSIGAVLLPVALVMQSIGHKRELHPPIPFTSKTNAIQRLALEQLVTFPRFALSRLSRKPTRGSRA